MQANLCDSLLGANWTAEQLSNIAILGNSFSTYHDRWSTPGFKSTAAKPDRLLRLVEAGMRRMQNQSLLGFRDRHIRHWPYAVLTCQAMTLSGQHNVR